MARHIASRGNENYLTDVPNRAIDHAGPDFLCIGMQKAGTQWLYDSLETCAGFWMPPIKEMHFFDRGFLEDDTRRTIDAQNLQRCRRVLSERRVADWGPSPARPMANGMRDREFSERWIRMADNGYHLDDYLALFQPKQSDLSGDVTPSYSALSEKDVESVRHVLPGVKIILLVRDPIARAWSAFNMHIRLRLMSKDQRKQSAAAQLIQQKATVEELSRYMNLHGYRQRSFPSVSYDRWASVFGKSHVHVTFFQDIVNRPVAVITDVCKFLNVALRSPPIPALNAKATELRAPMTAEHREFLRDYFEKEYLALQALFPERANEFVAQLPELRQERKNL
jgi:hypothetical protein